MKLKSLRDIPTTATGGIALTVNNLPSSVDGWAESLKLFDWYKVAAIKLTFIPSATAIANQSYRALIVWHDPNTIDTSAGATYQRAISYANSKIVNLQRKWKVYYKMAKTIAVGNSTAAIMQDRYGYTGTDVALATQSIGLFAVTPLTAVTTVGNLLITYHVLFKGQRYANVT